MFCQTAMAPRTSGSPYKVNLWGQLSTMIYRIEVTHLLFWPELSREQHENLHVSCHVEGEDGLLLPVGKPRVPSNVLVLEHTKAHGRHNELGSEEVSLVRFDPGQIAVGVIDTLDGRAEM